MNRHSLYLGMLWLAVPFSACAVARPGSPSPDRGTVPWRTQTTVERSQFDLEQPNSFSLPSPGPAFGAGPDESTRATLMRVHQAVGFERDRFSADLLVGAASLESGLFDREDAGISFGARAQVRGFELGPFGTSATLQWTNNRSKTSNFGIGADTEWQEADVRLLATLRPDDGNDAWQLAPYAGAGYRHLDGEHEWAGIAPSFDAQLTYAILGCRLAIRDRAAMQLSVEALLGEVLGGQVAFTVRF